MTALELSRLQFAVVTVYHYLFVPLSISLSALTAGLQTAWWRTRDERYSRATLLAGKLLMATFAVGVVTGLVQEFQFGLSWSAFAQYYGDVFGPTLAIEGMLAFFLEATFLGLWWFGRDRLRPGLHLATIWVVAVGTLISAYVILAANAFMQHPVGATIDPATGRAVLGSFGALLTNPVVVASFPHTIAGAFMAGGALLLAIGMWRRRDDAVQGPTWRVLARVGAWTTLVGGAAVSLTGDVLGKVMTAVQPMKMASAEALYETTSHAPFSLFAIQLPGMEQPWSIDVPWLLSFLATGDPTATVQGIDDLQRQYELQFGPGNYTPWIPVAYWTFRLMIGLGVAATAAAAYVLWRTRRGRDLTPAWFADRWLLRFLWVLPVLPTAAATFGWLFTETARQPWLVFGLFQTRDGVSPTLTPVELVASLAGFALVYGVLAVVWVRLVLHVSRQEPTPLHPTAEESRPEPVLEMSY
ncbi:cytochrome ubiquinol oxidase subunit I [Actinomycetospora sp. NBRC 106378]|uniref:cytochrome ubiquinol oxidase subunit I n=1 Tax=Actinomycetospora sp. NBRC 106378 TaxID=3032208 RepID=UPI0024A0AA8D|nr:cytochrome ubiquinol oxidase subunit I [Actinomycetospora sp. NBRC 106378]GLZ55867.1 cytochrome ubiquinol oxidase subunit I [Actinomycetospora sp. NBRC 106378]